MMTTLYLTVWILDPNFHTKFLEILCPGDGRVRRFAAGTKAGFALDRINRKLPSTVSPATCIEAVKEGEEHVEFGPNADLVIYGPDWRLQTLHEEDNVFKALDSSRYITQGKKTFMYFSPEEKGSKRPKPKLSVRYFAKIALAFCFIFLLAGTFTLLLQNIPNFLLYLQA
eukprot:Gb_22277 [translate_table: standard]